MKKKEKKEKYLKKKKVTGINLTENKQIISDDFLYDSSKNLNEISDNNVSVLTSPFCYYSI